MHVLYPGDENEKCTRSVAMTSNVKGREQLFSDSPGFSGKMLSD